MELKEGYKQTEVGVIPEDWAVRQIGAMLTIKHGRSQHAVIDSAGEYPILATGGQIGWANKFLYDQPSVLIGRKGTIDRPQYTESPFWSVDTLFYSEIRKPNNAKFFYYRFCLIPWRQYNEASGVPSLNAATIARIEIPTPPTNAEQEAIAEALSDADALIKSLEQLVTKKRLIKQGAMQELLTGKRRLPGFSGAWQKTTVGANILKSFCGPSPTCEERNIEGSGEWGVLKTTAITWENGWDWRRHKTLPKSYWNQPNIELRVGDVLVTKAGPRHRVGVAAWIDQVPGRIIPSGKMIALRPDPNRAVPLMLSAAIAAPEAQIFLDQRTTGMAESQVNFENNVLLQTPIRLPFHDEQIAIAIILDDMDSEIAVIETKLEKARQVKQGMMHELLTGNIRLIQPENSHA